MWDAAGKVWAVTEHRSPVQFTVVDLRGMNEAKRRLEATRTSDALFAQRFNLEAGPLLRAAVIMMAEDDTWLVFALHHSIFDAVSRAIFIEELTLFYRARLSGEPVELPRLTCEYRDFVRAQRMQSGGASGARSLEYWRCRLAGATTIFRLPYDRKSPVGDTSSLPLVCGRVEPEVLAALRDLARECQSTLSAVVRAVLSMVLMRWTRSVDVSLWVCDSGRWRPELEGVVGCFPCFWPLRVDLSGDPSFTEALRRVHASYTESLPHAYVSPTMLKPELDRIRGGQYYPGLLFNYLPSDIKGWPGEVQQRSVTDGLRMTGRFAAGSMSAMMLSVLESAYGIEWFFEHSSHLFEEATVERVSAAFSQALQAFAGDRHLSAGAAIQLP
jgi:hypothetical protein